MTSYTVQLTGAPQTPSTPSISVAAAGITLASTQATEPSPWQTVASPTTGANFVFHHVLSFLTQREQGLCDQVCKDWSSVLRERRVFTHNGSGAQPQSPVDVDNLTQAVGQLTLGRASTPEVQGTPSAGIENLTQTPGQLTLVGAPSLEMQGLPHELMGHIFSYVGAANASRVSLVCRDWNQYFNDDYLWKCFAAHDLGHLQRENPAEAKSAKESYREMSSRFNRNLDMGIYIDRWIEPIRYPDSVTCQCVKDEMLYLGTRSGLIQIWDLNTGELIRTLDGKLGSTIRSLCLPNEEQIIFGSADNKFRILNLETNECEELRHEYGFTINPSLCCLTEDGRKLITASDDTVIILNLVTHTVEKTFDVDLISISSLCLTPDEKLVVGSKYGSRIAVWNLQTYTCEKRCKGDHTSSICSLCVTKEGRLMSCESTGKTRIWDSNMRTYKSFTELSSFCIQSLHLTNSGKLIMTLHNGSIMIHNYNASNGEVFEALANMFSMERSYQAQKIFERMPADERAKIYRKFEEIKGLSVGSGRNAFEDIFDPSTTTAKQRAEAILNRSREG